MAGARIKFQSVKLPEFPDAAQRLGTERTFSIERVENDTFEKVAEGHVSIFGESLEYFQQSLLDPDAGLDALDIKEMFAHWYQCISVPQRAQQKN